MADLKQVLTYAQTFEINFPSGNDVPVTNPGTIGSITGTGPYNAKITNMAQTAGLAAGNTITARGGSGNLGAGGTNTITNVVSETIIDYSSTGGAHPIAGGVFNISTTPISYPGTDVDVTNSYAVEINGTELFRGDVTVTSATTLLGCNAVTATQCFAYIKADAGNTDAITITYVEPIGPSSVDIAILAPGQSLYLPFIAIGGTTELQGTAFSGTQGVYVSASFN